MEINGSGNRPPIDTSDKAQASKTGTDNPQSAGRPSSPTGGADTFSLTNKASQLQQLESQIAELPVVDTQRVQDVQHALATGTLEVEPARVADKMLSFESGLDTSGGG